MAELKSGKSKEAFDANVHMIKQLGFSEAQAKQIAHAKAKTKQIKR